MKKLIIILIILIITGCSHSKNVHKNLGYLVTIEVVKPHNFKVHKLRNANNVDSVITRNFGYAIKEFNSDTLFVFSPYFKFETLNKTIYVEKKDIKFKNK